MSVKDADCVRFVWSFNVPHMLVGDGYIIRNVARYWYYETAVAVGVESQNGLSYNNSWVWEIFVD